MNNDKQTNNEPPAVRSLYDNLAPYANGGEMVWVVNHDDGMRYLTVAVASAGGDAGGDRMTSSQPHRLFPGLNKVSAAWWARVESDAKRQRDRNGGPLVKMLDSDRIERVKSLDKTSPDKVDAWLARSGDLEVIGELREHPKHQAAALKHWKAWHSNEASNDVKTNRHFWRMAENSRKVA